MGFPSKCITCRPNHDETQHDRKKHTGQPPVSDPAGTAPLHAGIPACKHLVVSDMAYFTVSSTRDNAAAMKRQHRQCPKLKLYHVQCICNRPRLTV
eukprot:scaffold234702_cov52-Prasinocladus_malaysianus.AAC.2